MNENRVAGRNGPTFDDDALLAELAQLASAPLPEFVFLQELLKRAMLGLRGEAGAIWMCDAERRLVLQQEVCLETTGFLKDPAMQAACQNQFAEVFRAGGVVWQQVEQEIPGGDKRGRSLLLAALARDSQVAGLVQVFEGPYAGDEDRPRRIQFLRQLCGIATSFWQNHAQLPPLQAPPVNAALMASATEPALQQQAPGTRQVFPMPRQTEFP